jgi:hypothetical protein
MYATFRTQIDKPAENDLQILKLVKEKADLGVKMDTLRAELKEKNKHLLKLMTDIAAWTQCSILLLVLKNNGQSLS